MIELYFFFVLMIRRPPRSTRADTLFPYPTLFRSYGKAELGSIVRLHGARFADRIADFDAQRRARGQPTVTDLDGAERFSIKVHMPGDVAAPLIYTATALDYLSIDRDAYDIVAVAGNSMGWHKIGRAYV